MVRYVNDNDSDVLLPGRTLLGAIRASQKTTANKPEASYLRSGSRSSSHASTAAAPRFDSRLQRGTQAAGGTHSFVGTECRAPDSKACGESEQQLWLSLSGHSIGQPCMPDQLLNAGCMLVPGGAEAGSHDGLVLSSSAPGRAAHSFTSPDSAGRGLRSDEHSKIASIAGRSDAHAFNLTSAAVAPQDAERRRPWDAIAPAIHAGVQRTPGRESITSASRAATSDSPTRPAAHFTGGASHAEQLDAVWGLQDPVEDDDVGRPSRWQQLSEWAAAHTYLAHHGSPSRHACPPPPPLSGASPLRTTSASLHHSSPSAPRSPQTMLAGVRRSAPLSPQGARGSPRGRQRKRSHLSPGTSLLAYQAELRDMDRQLDECQHILDRSPTARRLPPGTLDGTLCGTDCSASWRDMAGQRDTQHTRHRDQSSHLPPASPGKRWDSQAPGGTATVAPPPSCKQFNVDYSWQYQHSAMLLPPAYLPAAPISSVDIVTQTLEDEAHALLRRAAAMRTAAQQQQVAHTQVPHHLLQQQQHAHQQALHTHRQAAHNPRDPLLFEHHQHHQQPHQKDIRDHGQGSNGGAATAGSASWWPQLQRPTHSDHHAVEIRDSSTDASLAADGAASQAAPPVLDLEFQLAMRAILAGAAQAVSTATACRQPAALPAVQGHAVPCAAAGSTTVPPACGTASPLSVTSSDLAQGTDAPARLAALHRLRWLVKAWQTAAQAGQLRAREYSVLLQYRRLLRVLRAWQYLARLQREAGPQPAPQNGGTTSSTAFVQEQLVQDRKLRVAEQFRCMYCLHTSLARWRENVRVRQELRRCELMQQAAREEEERVSRHMDSVAQRFWRLYAMHRAFVAWHATAAARVADRQQAAAENQRQLKVTGFLRRVSSGGGAAAMTAAATVAGAAACVSGPAGVVLSTAPTVAAATAPARTRHQRGAPAATDAGPPRVVPLPSQQPPQGISASGGAAAAAVEHSSQHFPPAHSTCVVLRQQVGTAVTAPMAPPCQTGPQHSEGLRTAACEHSSPADLQPQHPQQQRPPAVADVVQDLLTALSVLVPSTASSSNTHLASGSAATVLAVTAHAQATHSTPQLTTAAATQRGMGHTTRRCSAATSSSSSRQANPAPPPPASRHGIWPPPPPLQAPATTSTRPRVGAPATQRRHSDAGTSTTTAVPASPARRHTTVGVKEMPPRSASQGGDKGQWSKAIEPPSSRTTAATALVAGTDVERDSTERRLESLRGVEIRQRRQVDAVAAVTAASLAAESQALAALHYTRHLMLRCGLDPWCRLHRHAQALWQAAGTHQRAARLRGGWRALCLAVWRRRWSPVVQEVAAVGRGRQRRQADMVVLCFRRLRQWRGAARLHVRHRLLHGLAALRHVVAQRRQDEAFAQHWHLAVLLGAWRQVVSLEADRRLLCELQAQHMALQHATSALVARTLAGWRSAAAAGRQEREAAARKRRSWAKINGWLDEMAGQGSRCKAVAESSTLQPATGVPLQQPPAVATPAQVAETTPFLDLPLFTDERLLFRRPPGEGPGARDATSTSQLRAAGDGLDDRPLLAPISDDVMLHVPSRPPSRPRGGLAIDAELKALHPPLQYRRRRTEQYVRNKLLVEEEYHLPDP